MAEYTAIAQQTVLTGQNVIFTESPIPCTKGQVIHRNDSGIFTVKGSACNCPQCYARYRVTFAANIAVADGGTATDGASIAIALNGEALGSAAANSVPVAVGDFNNVNVFAYIDVPRGCCYTISVTNNGTQGIVVENAALAFERVC